jgi:ubiquinone biosynthesis O-methyltransferase
MTSRTIISPQAYALWHASELGALTEQIENDLLIELLGDVAGQQVLDVGCGDGAVSVYLAQRGALVTGIDASEDMVRAAKKRSAASRRHVAFAAATAERLPFPDASFDAVLAKTVLCFVDDADAVVREIARVLKPGGRFVIGELGKWSLWAASRRVRAWFGSPVWRLGRFRTPAELRSLAEAAGLEVRRLEGAVYFPRWLPAARVMAPFDASLRRMSLFGAAFLALSASRNLPSKPADSSADRHITVR